MCVYENDKLWARRQGISMEVSNWNIWHFARQKNREYSSDHLWLQSRPEHAIHQRVYTTVSGRAQTVTTVQMQHREQIVLENYLSLK